MSDCNAPRLSSVTSIAASRNSRPSASSIVRPSRTLATLPIPSSISLQAPCAVALDMKPGAIAVARNTACMRGKKRFIATLTGRSSIEVAASCRRARLPQTVLEVFKASGEGVMQMRQGLQSRRKFLTSVAAAGALVVTGARGDDGHWPDHPVRIVVPYPAGGSTDVLTRILGERLKDIFGQPFVIENRAGAGGNIGIAAVTGSPPDGYTIGS